MRVSVTGVLPQRREGKLASLSETRMVLKLANVDDLQEAIGTLHPGEQDGEWRSPVWAGSMANHRGKIDRPSRSKCK